MSTTFQLTCVAFMRSTGGRVRLLFAIDRDGVPMFEGEPALLAEHRPGADPSGMRVEGPDSMQQSTADLVRVRACEAIASAIEQAHDDAGAFVGDRILGTVTVFTAPSETFGT